MKLLARSFFSSQVHDVEFAPNLDIILRETLPALDRLRTEGKVGAIGEYLRVRCCMTAPSHATQRSSLSFRAHRYLRVSPFRLGGVGEELLCEA